MMISFSGTQFPKLPIRVAVFFYVRYGDSYLDSEEIMKAERGVNLDHYYAKPLGYQVPSFDSLSRGVVEIKTDLSI